MFFTDEDAALLAADRAQLRAGAGQLPALRGRQRARSKIKPDGFRHLDRVIDLCARHGIYTVIDLHAAPGGQNHHWHCDNPTHVPLLWVHRALPGPGGATSGSTSPTTTGATPAWPATTCSTSPPTSRGPSSGRCTSGWSPRSARSTPTTSCSWTATRTRPSSTSSASRAGQHRLRLPRLRRGRAWAAAGPTPGSPTGRWFDAEALERKFLAALGVLAAHRHAGLGRRVRPHLHRRSRARRAAPPDPGRPAGDLPPPRGELVDLDLQGPRAAGPGHGAARVALPAPGSASSWPRRPGSPPTAGAATGSAWPRSPARSRT